MRVNVNVVRHQEGADPSAVIYDAIQSAKAKSIDVLICDTAGRLQTKRNLMAELEKMNSVISKEYPQAARETLLALDATTGKNAISQAREFGEAAEISGIILTKMDGTAKGGIAVTVSDEFDIPVKFIGVGERLEDLRAFDPKSFAAGIFARDGAGRPEEDEDAREISDAGGGSEEADAEGGRESPEPEPGSEKGFFGLFGKSKKREDK